jgi:hypothetical protein
MARCIQSFVTSSAKVQLSQPSVQHSSGSSTGATDALPLGFFTSIGSGVAPAVGNDGEFTRPMVILLMFCLQM